MFRAWPSRRARLARSSALQSRLAERRLSGDATLSIRIPTRFERRGYAKRIIGPDGERVVVAPAPARLEDPLIRALAHAWRWKLMLESGGYGSVGELAAAEKVNFSYLCRFLRLTLPEPSMIDRIFEGHEGTETYGGRPVYVGMDSFAAS